MKTTMKAVLAAVLFSTAACSAEATDGETTAAAADQAVTSGSGGGIEMYIGYQVRAEIAAALGKTEVELDFGEVLVPGVLRVQHQYSVAVLRLETPSWALVSGLTPPNTGSWGIDSGLGVTFPRWTFQPDNAEQVASHAAAKKLFAALTRAKETSKTIAAGVVETTRASEHGSLACTKTTQNGRPDEVQCTIAGVGQVGGGGLLWDWATANEKAEENATNAK